MTVLVTGGTGFLGKIIIPYLNRSNQIISLGRDKTNQVLVDLANEIPNIPSVDAVIHAAGKAHVYPKTPEEINEFFKVNVTGTHHLLSALESHKPHAFVFISSVSVYGLEVGELITEETPLNGKSPYALSKIEAEKMVEDWCGQRGIDYLILRLPLIAGVHPKGNLGKMMTAIQQGRYLRIARGEANKSVVLATDVASLISDWLNKSNRTSGIYNLTDGNHPSFFDLEEGLKKLFHVKKIISIPKWLGQLLGSIGDFIPKFPVNSATLKKITCTFTFSDEKARKELGWAPRPVLEHLSELL